MIDQERDETLRTWLAACRDEPLDSRDLRYVPLDSLRGDDRKELLLDQIELAVEGKSTCQLFTGFRGTGKSTELARLKSLLEDAGFIVLMADAKDYHTLTRDLLIEELLPILAGAFGDAANSELPKDFTRVSWWDRFRSFLKKDLTLAPAIKLPGVELRAALRGDDTFLVSLKAALAGRVDTLAHQVHAFIAETVATLSKARPDTRGVVFIFDNLEKLSGPELEFRERIKSVLEVFSEHYRYLHIPSCHTVYSVPLYIQLLYPDISQLYDGSLEVLPTVKVTERDAARTPYEPGLSALRDLLARRIDLDAAFAPGVPERLILASGGHLRGLLDLVSDVLLRARRAALPVTRDAADAAIARFNEKRRAAVRADAAALLASVAADFSLDRVGDSDLARIAHYLDNHLVLCYRNGEGWYDLHPAIRDHVATLAVEDHDG